MADVDKILQLVADGVLSPEEADEILSATGDVRGGETATPPGDDPEPAAAQQRQGDGRQLRIEVSEGGKRVVNLRVPMNIAGWASSFLPGLSDEAADRIRGAVSSGERGPILDINGEDGSRVLIVSE